MAVFQVPRHDIRPHATVVHFIPASFCVSPDRAGAVAFVVPFWSLFSRESEASNGAEKGSCW